MDEALIIASVVVSAAALVVLVLLPNRGHEARELKGETDQRP
jgi:preprotein translocase subunit SecG